ncbi:putative 5-methylthioadenosine/S-adenosylhomocysteine deaminase [Megalodesulfovibrio gigas DSM 1382 = ATCC 19364]|uniref:Putative 5-methylthioadenosine/S-adenosylhomocysteine deaminase n=2 Tax=Megalodesulfovibrio gigas TaxID=879 RepID=T2GE66_MEGG1|nr:putative 5-methylthioadenosine/S-adenosylhomocysteine deaminase [Megalodesulfovibrio gigas DSM 1382 = ATCC 19364]
MPCDMVVEAGLLATQDDRRRVLANQALIIHGGLIQKILPLEDAAELRCARRLNLRHCVVLPGLVNAHTHSPMTLFRGLGDDMPLMEWLTKRIWPLEAGLTNELVHLGSQLACCEMAALGTTCFQDMYIFQEATAEAVEAFGLKAVLAEGILNVPTRSYQTPEEAYARIANLLADYAGHPRIRFAVAPHTVYTTSEAILRRSFQLAEAYDLPWCIHCTEDDAELEHSQAMYGMRPVALLDRLGCLSPRSVLVHGVVLAEAELHTLARAGASLVHCPRSNAKLASGLAPIAACLEAGVRVALGTDGPASSNSLNMFQEMGTAALMAKVREGDSTALPAQAALDMATVHAARALGWQDLGRLAEGGPADLTAVSLDLPRHTPCTNVVSHLVYACQGAGVELTMVDGHTVYERGCFPTVDYDGLRRELRDALGWARSRLDSISA